jgi:hypothetical protein
MSLDHFHERSPGPVITKPEQHTLDVAEVFLRAAFAIELKLAKDHVFGRSEDDPITIKVCRYGAGKTPRVQFVATAQINIGFEAGFVMNEIEVSALIPGEFICNDLKRRAIEVFLREGFSELTHSLLCQKEDDIHMIGESGLTIKDGSNAPADHVTQTQRFKFPSKDEKGLRWLHA